MKIPTKEQIDAGVLDLMNTNPATFLADGFDERCQSSTILSATMQQIVKVADGQVAKGELTAAEGFGSMLAGALRIGVSIGLHMMGMEVPEVRCGFCEHLKAEHRPYGCRRCLCQLKFKEDGP